MTVEKKIAIITSHHGKSWRSCEHLVPMLAKAYKLAFGSGATFVNVGANSSWNERLGAAQTVRRLNPEVVVFIEPAPNPSFLFHAIKEAYGRERLPRFCFHLYGGGLALDFKSWQWLEPHLLKTRCAFVFANPRQKALLAPLFKNRKNLSVCRFPVRASSHRFLSNLRAQVRRDYKWAPDDQVLVYFGRLSAQKNILALVRAFTAFANKNPRARLVLAGPFDDISLNFFSYLEKTGGYEARYRQLLNTLPPSTRKRIHYLGVLSSDQITELCNAADLFVSLGTYHNEDFGLAPLEALACGCPVVLTDWGGFSQYEGNTGDCRLIPVQISEDGIHFDERHAQKAFAALCLNQTDEKRRARSRRYKKKYSIETVAIQLQQILKTSKRFSGFSNEPQPFADGPNLAFPMGFWGDSAYRRMYRNYIAAKKNSRPSTMVNLTLDWLGEAASFRTVDDFQSEVYRRRTTTFERRER